MVQLSRVGTQSNLGYGRMFVKLSLPYLSRCLTTATSLVLVLSVVPTHSAAATGDSKPVLISTTGGKGGSWANMAELKKAAEKHDPKACAAYGDALLRGDGVKADTVLAMKFLREAAAAGEPNAAFRLGKIYDDGEFAPQDYAKAFEYYGAAAKAGVVEAQYNLGVLYASARGTKRDYVEGLAWLIVATKNGAGGDGEQKTREQLTKIKRQQLITLAEQRAAEILGNPAAASPAPATSEPVAPKKIPAPTKVDVGPAPAPAKINLAPVGPPPPALGTGLTPPHIEAPPPAPSTEAAGKDSGAQK